MGDGGTQPEFGDDVIMFNGVGDDSHETFDLHRKRKLEKWQSKGDLGRNFCKTAHKPYDRVVTACLCYLSTVTRREDPTTHEPIIGSEALHVSSDGHGNDFLSGLDLARAALPQYANLLDIPMGVMQDDRWCAPWVRFDRKGRFEVRFCIDGYGYILRPKTGESYRFETHEGLAKFLDGTKRAYWASWRPGYISWGKATTMDYPAGESNIWNATGFFDQARHDRIRKAQDRVLAKLFPVPMQHAHQPPAYVRPGEMPENAGREFCYSVDELLNHLKVA